MKIFNKFIWSKKKPSNKNDIWFDGSTWRMYTEEAWQSFTLPVDAADKVAKVIENASEVFQEKLTEGEGIVIEDNTISIIIDPKLSETSNNPVQNKTVTKALKEKINKTELATINGKSLLNGEDIVIEENSKIILDFEKLGEPIESDEDSMEMIYSKEQFESAVGMSMSEFIEKIKTSELVLSNGAGGMNSYYVVADEYTWTAYYKIPGLFSYVLNVNATPSEEKFFVGVYDEAADLPFARTEYVDEKHAQTEAQLTELSAEVEDVSVNINGGAKKQDISSLFAFVSNGGFYIDTTIGSTFTGNLLYTDSGDYAPKVDVSSFDNVVVYDGGSTGNRAVILTNTNNVVVFSAKWGDVEDGVIQVNVKELQGKYLYISKSVGVSCKVDALTTVEGLSEKISNNETKIDEARETIYGKEYTLEINESIGKFYLASGLFFEDETSRYADIDLSDYEGDTIIITLDNPYKTSGRCIGLAVDGKFIQYFEEKDYTNPVRYIIPANAHLYESHEQSSSISASILKKGLVDSVGIKDVFYVADNGSDDNEGSEGKPFATIQKAINSGASRIYVGGGVYKETLDLSNFNKKNLEILKRDSFGEVIIENTPTIVASQDGSLVDGSVVVYKLENVSGITSEMRFLLQNGVPYGIISEEERRPEQRGRKTRLNDTIIRKIRNVSSVGDAIAEIERAYLEDERYMYFLDGSTLYYSRPKAVSMSNPIVRPTSSKTLFENTPNNLTFTIVGIHTRFLVFNIHKSINSTITDCISEFAFGGGAFTYDGSIGITFNRCEAAGCCYGSTGDGFNGHADSIEGFLTGNPSTKCCTCVLQFCWSHDNNDDGFSDHERCESNIVGGLFEYNGKGGIVPAYGSHCTCYNVESRHNCNGFLSTGTPDETEGGEGTQLACYNCIASDNTNRYGQNYAGNVAETNAGFAAMNYRCKLIAVQCLAKGNKLGFFTNSEGGGKDGYSELIDCRALNNSQSSWYPKSKPEITIITNSETL